MPTYEYECQRCGFTFERFQSMLDEPLKRCPQCRGRVKRLLGTGAGIIFKGSGFYQTDYRSASYAKEARSGEGGDAPAGETKKKEPASPAASKADSGASAQKGD